MTIPAEHLVHLINQADRVFSVFLFACAREKLEEVADCERVGPKISTRTFNFRNKSGARRRIPPSVEQRGTSLAGILLSY